MYLYLFVIRVHNFHSAPTRGTIAISNDPMDPLFETGSIGWRIKIVKLLAAIAAYENTIYLSYDIDRPRNDRKQRNLRTT